MNTSAASLSPSRPVALVCALEYEIAPLIRGWRRRSIEHDGRKVRIFESENTVAAAAGIGKDFARLTAKVMVDVYRPSMLISCGLTGSLTRDLLPGRAVLASQVIDSESGKSWPTARGDIILVTANEVAGKESKQRLASQYQAQAVDMEAAGAAEVAIGAGIRFLAAKAISDPLDFTMPPVRQFVRPDGSLSATSYAVHVAVRPWLWRSSLQLARNSSRAVSALEHLLRQLIADETEAAKAVKLGQSIRSI